MPARQNPVAVNITGQHDSLKFQKNGFSLPLLRDFQQLLITADELIFSFTEVIQGKQLIGMGQIHSLIPRGLRCAFYVLRHKIRFVKPVIVQRNFLLHFPPPFPKGRLCFRRRPFLPIHSNMYTIPYFQLFVPFSFSALRSFSSATIFAWRSSVRV